MTRRHRPRYCPPPRWWHAGQQRLAAARWLHWPPLHRARRFVGALTGP